MFSDYFALQRRGSCTTITENVWAYRAQYTANAERKLYKSRIYDSLTITRLNRYYQRGRVVISFIPFLDDNAFRTVMVDGDVAKKMNVCQVPYHEFH